MLILIVSLNKNHHTQATAITVLAAAAVICSAHPYAPAVSSQYISQDNHGSYSYGYADPNSQKHESRSHDGVTHGGYSYVDGAGHVQSVKYTADPVHGFQVAGTNLPVGPAPAVHAVAAYHHAAPVHSVYAAPLTYAGHWAHGAAPIHINAHGVPHDTPEVAAAKIAHAHAHAEARAQHHHLWKRSLWGGHAAWSHAAAPVQIHNGVPVDTPEVQHAKAAHFAAHAAAGGHHHAGAYHGAYAVPQIHNGVPVDTPEVQHAKAAHFAAVAEASARDVHHGAAHHHYAAPAAHYAAGPVHHGAIHIPVIHNGVPVETPEVQHAKAAHYAAHAAAGGHGGYHHGGHDDAWAHGGADDGHWDGDQGHQW